MGVPILTSERYEADDVIGTLAQQAADAGFEVAIVTGDKDFFQLVHDGIKVYNPRDDGTWFDAAGVKEKFGVLPSQVVDVLALMGDTIDNIKGVPGIGEKGARDLIATYGSVENLLGHVSEISNKRYREGLLAHADDARQSRELARIHTDVPVPFEPDALRYRGVSREKCFALSTRRPRRRSERTTRSSRLWTSCASWPMSCAEPAASRSACCRMVRQRCVRPSSGCRSRPLPTGPGTCRWRRRRTLVADSSTRLNRSARHVSRRSR
jgi:5'-3' exonuclease